MKFTSITIAFAAATIGGAEATNANEVDATAYAPPAKASTYTASPALPNLNGGSSSGDSSTIQQIEDATDSWAGAVTVENNPRLVAEHFCKDGILWGTRSKKIRVGNDKDGAIEQYFDYFATLPGISVKGKAVYNIARVTPDVFVNNAIVRMTEDGLDDPFDARMTFIYRHSDDFKLNNGWCIFELHSSYFPERNESLKAIANGESAPTAASRLLGDASVTIPPGTYNGLGKKDMACVFGYCAIKVRVDATATIHAATPNQADLIVDATGASTVNLNCPGEPFTIDAATNKMTLTNYGAKDGCIQKALPMGVTLKSLTYDVAKNIIVIDVGPIGLTVEASCTDCSDSPAYTSTDKTKPTVRSRRLRAERKRRGSSRQYGIEVLRN